MRSFMTLFPIHSMKAIAQRVPTTVKHLVVLPVQSLKKCQPLTMANVLPMRSNDPHTSHGPLLTAIPPALKANVPAQVSHEPRRKDFISAGKVTAATNGR